MTYYTLLFYFTDQNLQTETLSGIKQCHINATKIIIVHYHDYFLIWQNAAYKKYYLANSYFILLLRSKSS